MIDQARQNIIIGTRTTHYPHIPWHISLLCVGFWNLTSSVILIKRYEDGGTELAKMRNYDSAHAKSDYF